MDEISRTEASKRDALTSCALRSTNRPSTISSIPLRRSVPRAGACEKRSISSAESSNPHHVTLEPRAVARALGGEAIGCSVSAPGPGHSPADRSLSVKIDPTARDGFLVHSFAGDDPMACRDYVRHTIGLSRGAHGHQRFVSSRPRPDPADNPTMSITRALRIWDGAHDPRGTIVETYLRSRKLELCDDLGAEVVRFHPALNYSGAHLPGMVALFRNVATNEPCGIHRTFLDHHGRKLGRRMLGRVKRAAIKLDPNENVALGLVIGEGLETGLAARLAGFRPVWAAGSAGAIAGFPVLPGIEAITILGEVDDGGASLRAAHACATRWMTAGRDAFVVVPLTGGDLADIWRELV
jgi:putative DNA primase/helicase